MDVLAQGNSAIDIKTKTMNENELASGMVQSELRSKRLIASTSVQSNSHYHFIGMNFQFPFKIT